MEGRRSDALSARLGGPQPRLLRRLRVRANRPGPAAQHLHGVAALAGGPEARTAGAWHGARLRSQAAQGRRMIRLEPGFLTGSVPPLITPFRDGEVDYDAYARLVKFQIDHGTHGILVNGTTAEPTTLTVEERNRLVKLAVEIAGKRIPVVAQTGSQSHAE